jgi:hypothetical protein
MHLLHEISDIDKSMIELNGWMGKRGIFGKKVLQEKRDQIVP